MSKEIEVKYLIRDPALLLLANSAFANYTSPLWKMRIVTMSQAYFPLGNYGMLRLRVEDVDGVQKLVTCLKSRTTETDSNVQVLNEYESAIRGLCGFPGLQALGVPMITKNRLTIPYRLPTHPTGPTFKLQIDQFTVPHNVASTLKDALICEVEFHDMAQYEQYAPLLDWIGIRLDPKIWSNYNMLKMPHDVIQREYDRITTPTIEILVVGSNAEWKLV